MRFAICAISAFALSGCSWLGHTNQGYKGQSSGYGYNKAANMSGYGHNGAHNPCVVYSPVQPVPAGCHPSQVTLSTGGTAGYAGQSSQYTTGGYGSHATQAGYQGANHKSDSNGLRKPKIRGAFSMGFEKSNAGAFLNYTDFPGFTSGIIYDPTTFDESYTTGSVASGQIEDRLYSAYIENVDAPEISFDDVHSTPFRLAVGAEYILSPKATVFANAGYSYAEGESGAGVVYRGALTETVTTQDYDADTLAPIGGPVTNTTVLPNAGALAHLNYDFNDMQRYDFEVGGRFYFDPVVKDQGVNTLTPFISASAGLTHHNAQSVQITQDQAFYRENYDDIAGGSTSEITSYYDPVQVPTSVDLYEAQWVPSGALMAGMEWQVTPKTALALETGLRFEGAREYTNGESGDVNVAIPLTLRGSFNF